MKKNIYCILLALCMSIVSYAQSSPKQELRGVWIASLGIDWPQYAGTSSSVISAQKSQLVSLFDKHKTYGINALFFHVRPKCDAVYKSKLEPWSQYLTGKQGAAPEDKNYDPLEFAVQEAHKRGMELHAWLNPYRVLLTGDDPNSVDTSNVMRKHPDWIIKCKTTEYRFLNPGLPEVRAYLIKVIMDIVRRYDIDGVHFDDYFYPYSEYGTYDDDATYSIYKGTFTDKASWRNNNVNMMLAELNDSIKSVKPWIKFGISPSGNPSVNTGIFCDAFGWLQGKYTDQAGVKHSGTAYIDYIMPQLYWASYGGYLPNWSGVSVLNGRHLYIGIPSYKYVNDDFTPNELGWEMRVNRTTPTVQGGVFYNSGSLISNYAGCTDSLIHHFNLYSAITPKMAWIPGNSKKPNAPKNLRFEKNTVSGKYELHWDAPEKAQDGDSAFSYIVYRSATEPTETILSDPSKILGTWGETTLPSGFAKYSATNGDYYVVTAIDRYSNESPMSSVLHQSMPDQVPAAPELQAPANRTANLTTSVRLSWKSAPLAESYILQIAKDSLFNSMVTIAPEHRSLTFLFSGIQPGTRYFWRISAAGAGGNSAYSNFYSFESGIPGKPVLIAPAHTSTENPLWPTLQWVKDSKAISYQLQIGTSAAMTSGILLDTVMTDTALTMARKLQVNKIYYWRARGKNSLGTGPWSDLWGFKTQIKDAVEEGGQAQIKEYSLVQNYPNPFNPSTQVKYSTAKDGMVKLSIFDVLGREVAVLVNGFQKAGSYTAELNAGKLNLASGIYLYTLKTEGFVSTKKMLLVK